MAIKTATIQVRMGLESELDVSKALPGEWLLSTDTKYIRMCVAYGIVLRMATYESFEADMAKIKELVSTAQSLKDIVMRLASEVGSKTTIVLEATEEAKKYMEEAKKYSELAFATTPEGYEVLVRDVDLLKNSIVQTTDRTLYGSKEGGIKLIGVKGASEQAVYSGAQLLNMNEVNSKLSANISFSEPVLTMSKTTAQQYSYGRWGIGSATDLAGQTIYLKGVYSGVRGRVALGYYNDDTYVMVDDNTNVPSNFRMQLVVDADTYSGYNVGVWLYVDVSQVGAEGDSCTYSNIMVSTNPDATYEPYVGNAPSPSPSYPQVIESVGDSGSLVIEQSGKNKLFPRRFISGMAISTNGTIVSDTRYGLRYVKVEGGKTYCLSRLMDTSGMNASLWGFTDSFPTIGNTCSYNPWYSNHATSPTITAPSDGYFVLRERIDGTYEAGTGFEVQFEEGTIRTEYVEDYSLITIPLNEPLTEGDEIAVIDGVWGVLRNTASVVFDGSDDEAWLFTAQYANRALISINDSNMDAYTVKNALCSHFVYNESVYFDGQNEVGFVTFGTNLLIRMGSESEINTIDLWRTWLSENPITVEYELATPVFEPFTDQTPFYQMQSYDTVTYISTDSKVEPSIEVKYAKTEGDAITLGNYNRTKLNEIRISELMALQTELATALVAGSEV